MNERFLQGPAGIPLRALLLLHAAGAAAYWWIQPRGFSFGGRAFFEHEVIVPAVLALSFVALLEPWRPRPALIAAGALTGFGTAVSMGFAMTGDALPARAMFLALAGTVGVFFLLFSRVCRLGLRAGGLFGGGLAGALLGAAFIFCTWAPPPSTRPSQRMGDSVRSAPGPGMVVRGGYRIRALGTKIMVEEIRPGSTGGRLLVSPSFEFPAASGNGTWTLFRFRPVALPPWNVESGEGNSLRFSASTDDIDAEGFAWVDGGRVHLRCATTVKRDLAAHLASAARVQLPPGPVVVDGIPWSEGPVEFFAFRRGRLEFLRASAAEKGPFIPIRAWDPRDPVLECGGWKVQVAGWADQASLEESPTAGWGVSQGTIERAGSEFHWSLASTSVGRGWHAVRTAAGTYVLEIILSR